MPPANLAGPLETSPSIEIASADAITILDAINLAHELSFPVGKSTLQRWATHWRDTPGGAVRCVLSETTAGKIYKLHRDDFEAWVLDQKRNGRPREVSQDPTRPHEASRDLKRPLEVSAEAEEAARVIKELENENLQLKIDVGVRKQLLERAKDEMDSLRSTADKLLRENGALQYQILQIAPPPTQPASPQERHVDNVADRDAVAGV